MKPVSGMAAGAILALLPTGCERRKEVPPPEPAATAAEAGRVDSGSAQARDLVDRYLKASYGEQIELDKVIVGSAREIVAVAAAGLKDVPFSIDELPDEGGGLCRNSAAVLVRFADDYPYVEDVQSAFRAAVKPLLASELANERGWSNYVLRAMSYPGDLDDFPGLISREENPEVLWAILGRLGYRLSNDQDGRERKAKESAWRTELIDALEKCLESKDPWVLQSAASCMQGLPAPRTTEIGVDAIRSKAPSAPYFVDMMRQRIGRRHPAEPTVEQQRAIVPALIDMKIKEPDRWADTLTDVLMQIPDKRVLPAFFEMLRRHRDKPNVQRQASYSIWIVFSKSGLREETPEEIYHMEDLNADPIRSGAVWRAWYEVDGDRLFWDEEAKQYGLRRKAGEGAGKRNADE